MAGGLKPCPPATFSIQILLIFLRFEVPPNSMLQCYTDLKLGSSTYCFLLFPFLGVPSIKFKGG